MGNLLLFILSKKRSTGLTTFRIQANGGRNLAQGWLTILIQREDEMLLSHYVKLPLV